MRTAERKESKAAGGAKEAFDEEVVLLGSDKCAGAEADDDEAGGARATGLIKERNPAAKRLRGVPKESDEVNDGLSSLGGGGGG